MELESVGGNKLMETTSGMSGWLKLVGIVSIVGGAITILLTLGMGIIIAWLPIWQGILLVRASNSSQEVAGGKSESIVNMISPLKTYFIIQGILILISIFISIMATMLVGFGGLAELFKFTEIY